EEECVRDDAFRLGGDGLSEEGDGLAVGVVGLGQLLLVAQDVADGVPAIPGFFRPGFAGLSVEGDGLVRLLAAQEGFADVDNACAGLAVDGDGSAVGVGGLGRFLLVAPDVADLAPVIAGSSRYGLDELSVDGDGLVQIPALT